MSESVKSPDIRRVHQLQSGLELHREDQRDIFHALDELLSLRHQLAERGAALDYVRQYAEVRIAMHRTKRDDDNLVGAFHDILRRVSAALGATP